MCLNVIDTFRTGMVFKLAGCGDGGSASKCKMQTQLLRDALGDNGDQIRVNGDGTVSLAQGVSASEFASGGEFQKGILALIGDKNTFSLVTGTGKAADVGGGEFVPDKKAGGGTIDLESGMFPRQTGDVVGTAEIALVHEVGHALSQVFPKHFWALNGVFSGTDMVLALRGEGYAVNFENRYRKSVGVDIRTSYDPSLLDPIRDWEVDLFPAE